MAKAPTDPLGGDRSHRLLVTAERLLALQATEVSSALTEAAALIQEVLAAEKVDVFILDPASESLVAWGTSPTPLGDRQRALGLHRMPLANRGRAVLAYLAGTPFITGHSENDPEELVGVKQDLGVRSTLLAPLNVQHERRGLLSVASTETDRFTADDLAFVVAAAGWVGTILHRAELVEQMTKVTAEEVRRRTADDLITSLAHDLRVPLVPLRGYLELIQAEANQQATAPFAEYARRAIRNVTRIERMLTDLLDTTRLEQGLFSLRTEAINVAALVRDTADDIGTPNVLIEVEAPPQLLVVADQDRLRQSIENLLSNALRYTPPGSAVQVTVSGELHEHQRWAVVTISDHGPGIAPERLPHIFTRFATDSTHSGLGLGLFLARGMAEAHGGTLTVESAPGHGATFRLALPCLPVT